MGNTLYAVTYILYSLFESYILYKLMNIFLGKPHCERKYVILVYTFRFVIGVIQYYYLPYIWYNVTFGIMRLFIITFCYEKNIQKRLVAVILAFMCLIATEAVVAVIYELCNIHMSTEGYNGNEFAHIGMAITLNIIYKIIARFKNIDNEVLIPNSFQVVSIIISIIMYLLITIILVYENMSKSVGIVSTISLLLILFLLVYLYDFIAKNYAEKIQKEMIEKEKQYYYKQVELMQENEKKLSDFRHDINNHLSVIQGMLENDSESTKKYVEKLVNKVENTRTFSNTGNIAIDSVINYKLSKAEDEGITINANIILPPKLRDDIQDMVTVLGNILDNAIEANRVPNLEKYININIRYKSGMVFIKVTNAYDGRMNMKNGQIVTKKNNKELHGIGLKSVKNVVDKYDGTVDIDYDDKQFRLKVVLYI